MSAFSWTLLIGVLLLAFFAICRYVIVLQHKRIQEDADKAGAWSMKWNRPQ
jgi:hypothetical protein